jgi:chloramphenicol 3-O phosphotransferase
VLIILSGPSSSGKTTLARAIQAVAVEPLVHLEADRFWPDMPPGPTGEDHTYRSRVILAVHESIATLGRSGLHVVVDGSLPMERGLHLRCIEILRSVPETRIVAVRCAAEVLRMREAARPDRTSGWAEQQLATIFHEVTFDADVDTSSSSPGDCARDLLQALGLD